MTLNLLLPRITLGFSCILCRLIELIQLLFWSEFCSLILKNSLILCIFWQKIWKVPNANCLSIRMQFFPFLIRWTYIWLECFWHSYFLWVQESLLVTSTNKQKQFLVLSLSNTYLLFCKQMKTTVVLWFHWISRLCCYGLKGAVCRAQVKSEKWIEFWVHVEFVLTSFFISPPFRVNCWLFMHVLFFIISFCTFSRLVLLKRSSF